MHDSGLLFVAIGQLQTTLLDEQPHLIVYDSLNNSVTKSYRGVANYITGVTSSIVQGSGVDDFLYIGGHVTRNTENEKLSNLAIFKYDYATETTELNEIVYKSLDGECDDPREYGKTHGIHT